MPAYIVKVPDRLGGQVAVVFAQDATYAVSMAGALYRADGRVWAQATATEIVAGTDFEGWKLRVVVKGAAAQSAPLDIEVTGVASDTIDLIAAAMVTALNGTADIAAASYDGATNILTVAAVGDGIGDGSVDVYFTPAGDARGNADAYIGTITDGGVAAAALTVQLAADAVVVGNIVGQFRPA